MSMNSARTLVKVEITIDDQGNHSVYSIYQYTFDDPNDNMLPVTTHKGFTSRAGEDVSGHDLFVQDIVATAHKDYVAPVAHEPAPE